MVGFLIENIIRYFHHGSRTRKRRRGDFLTLSPPVLRGRGGRRQGNVAPRRSGGLAFRTPREGIRKTSRGFPPLGTWMQAGVSLTARRTFRGMAALPGGCWRSRGAKRTHRLRPMAARRSKAGGPACLQAGPLKREVLDFPDRSGGGLGLVRDSRKGSGCMRGLCFGGSWKGGIGDENSWNRTTPPLRGLISAQGVSYGGKRRSE